MGLILRFSNNSFDSHVLSSIIIVNCSGVTGNHLKYLNIEAIDLTTNKMTVIDNDGENNIDDSDQDLTKEYGKNEDRDLLDWKTIQILFKNYSYSICIFQHSPFKVLVLVSDSNLNLVNNTSENDNSVITVFCALVSDVCDNTWENLIINNKKIYMYVQIKNGNIKQGNLKYLTQYTYVIYFNII